MAGYPSLLSARGVMDVLENVLCMKKLIGRHGEAGCSKILNHHEQKSSDPVWFSLT